MANQSICPRCQKSGFEAVREELANTRLSYLLIRCSNCGTVVGADENINLAYSVQALGFAIQAVGATVEDLKKRLGTR
jgi:uncharacterized Zn finger protein